MTSEEMDRFKQDMGRLSQEMRERGRMARFSEHPMFFASVLMETYRNITLDIQRDALAYAYLLIVDAAVSLDGRK
jgi:aminoglycoside N3'-acetyltransferase